MRQNLQNPLAIVCLSAMCWIPVARAQNVVKVDTGGITVNDTVTSGTFTFTNPTNSTKDVWLKPFFAKGITFQGRKFPSVQDAGGQALDSAWLATFPSVVPWLSGFPQHFVLAPNESRKITVQVVPPSSLPNGRYRTLFQYVQSLDTGSGEGIIHHGYMSVVYMRTAYRGVAGAPSPAFRLGPATVRHSPAVVSLTDRTPTSPVTFNNPTDSAIAVWLAVDFPDVTQFDAMINPAFGIRINGELFPGGLPGGAVERAWHNEIPDAELWLGGFPQYFVIPPHGTQTVPLQIVPYSSLKDGQYYARLRYVQTPRHDGQSSNANAFVLPNGALDIVYTKGPALPPVQLTNGTVAPRDGVLHACATVRQPGIGMVGILHATVHDTQGKAVHASDSTGRTGPWEFTSRFASLQEQMGLDVNEPRCVRLPKFAPGNYVFQLEVFRIDDVNKQQPAKLNVPFVVQ